MGGVAVGPFVALIVRGDGMNATNRTSRGGWLVVGGVAVVAFVLFIAGLMK